MVHCNLKRLHGAKIKNESLSHSFTRLSLVMSILFKKQRWKLAQHYSHSVNNATVPKALSPARMAVRCNHTKAVMADLYSAMKGALHLADESRYLYNSTTTGSSGTIQNYRNTPLQDMMSLQTGKLQHLHKVPSGPTYINTVFASALTERVVMIKLTAAFLSHLHSLHLFPSPPLSQSG